jgi:hypothetical protein
MKKFIFGCLAVVLLVGIGGAVGAYYFLWKPGKAYVVEFAKLKEIPQLNQKVRNTAAFAPPADNVLMKESVDRFMRTQQTIHVRLGQRLDEFSAKYRLLGQADNANYKPSVSEVMSAYKDMAGLILEAKRAQVDALNENNYSLAEYDWTRRTIYEATGIPINPEFEKALRAIGEANKPEAEKTPDTTPAPVVNVPEKNRELVSPHMKELTERAVLAAFGL